MGLINAKKIIKTQTQDEDIHPIGSFGYAIGFLNKLPESGDPEYSAYIIVWEDDLELPVLCDSRKCIVTNVTKEIEYTDLLKSRMSPYRILKGFGAPVDLY